MSFPKCGIDGSEIGFLKRCVHYPAPASSVKPEPELSLDVFVATDSGEPIPYDEAEIEGFMPPQRPE